MKLNEQIKVCVFDYDGTLVDYNGSASEKTVYALNKLKENGYKVALSSGRPKFLAERSFKKELKDFEFDYIIGYNGQEFYDSSTGETSYLSALTKEEIADIASKFDNDKIVLAMYQDGWLLINRPSEMEDLVEFATKRLMYPPTVVNFKPEENEFPNNERDNLKVMAFSPKTDTKEIDEYLKTLNLSDYSSFRSTAICFEINKKGVDKGLSIKFLMEKLNLTNEEIMAFGDMDNDIAMLKACVGVAMENGKEEIKKEITLHTASVEEDGIYDILTRENFIEKM